ncbi:MAG TPA: hypothetical protein VGR57_02605 [Ktedonobacterales bacterium]|nr:hypothetical protein [Ktedonobacterales bacterium]
MGTQVVLVNDVPRVRNMLCAILEDAGYTLSQARDVAIGLDALRASTEACVVLFNQGIANEGMALLQAAASDLAVGRHAFVLLTAYPEGLALTWRPLLQSLRVPIIAKPFDLDTLLRVVADAAARAGVHGGRPLSP